MDFGGKTLKLTFQAALALAVVAAPLAAVAQTRADQPDAGYRQGMPAVNEARPEAPQSNGAEVTDAFRRWYVHAHRPAMLIFWNRELTDEATTRYADTTTGREETKVSKSGVGGQNATHTSEDSTTSKVTMQETSKRPLTGGLHTELDPMQSARLETAFQSAWLGAGVELVDRAAIIRKMSTVATQQDRADVQFLESASLGQGIEYLIEVLPTPNAQSPTGITFMVKVKHLPSSTVVAQFLSQAKPPLGAVHWVVGSDGFEKHQDDHTSPETIGAELALEAMTRMAR